MLSLVGTNEAGPNAPQGSPIPPAPPADAPPALRLAVDGEPPVDAVQAATAALDHAERRLANLKDLLSRFDLDDDDDGPRAA
ncbi:MAG: hypothetical protein AAFX79_08675 [Planctomycetota bacterium]